MVTARPADILDDAAFWERAERIMKRAAEPFFREAFLIGAALGANTEPRSDTRRGQREATLAALMRLAASERERSPVQLLAGLLHGRVMPGQPLRGQRDRFPGVDDDFLPIPGPDGQTALPFDFEAITDATDQFIATYTDRWWNQIETTTRESLRSTLRRAAAEGLTIEQVISEIEPLFGTARASRIAVSETTNLMGQGAQLTYERAGFTGWIWRTVRDSAVDAICDGLAQQSDPQFDGVPFPMTRRFERAHVNCRCWPVPAGKPSVPQGGAAAPGGQPVIVAPKDTTALHSVDGKWNAARQQLHDQIVRDFLAEATPVESPTAYVMGGGPASGKSTVIERGLVDLPKNIVHIDADAIKLRLPEYQQMVEAGDAGAAAFAHEESSYLSKRLVRESAQSSRNLLLDGTGDSSVDSLAAKIADMRAGGHRIVGNYVSLDTDLAVRLAEQRALRTGRKVPYDFLRDTHRAVSQTLPQAIERNLFDELTLYDTNINGQPRRVLSVLDRKVTVHDRALWRDFLVKGEQAPGGFGFEAGATYAEDRATAAAIRERIAARPDVRAQAEREAHLERAEAAVKEHEATYSDVIREHRAQGFMLNNPPADSPYARYRDTAKALRTEKATLKDGIERAGQQLAQSILEGEAIYAETAASFEIKADWVDRLRTGAQRQTLQRGMEDFKRLIGPRSPVEGTRSLTFLRHQASRDYYRPGTNRIWMNAKSDSDVVVHEMGHWLEDRSTATQDLRKAHVAARTVGERAQRLSSLKPGYRFGRDEIALKDEFIDPYVGKVYGSRAGSSSEVISMGLQEMYRNPWALARDDPRLFDFIYDLLQGWR
jgi:predicted ABC-type ATPase